MKVQLTVEKIVLELEYQHQSYQKCGEVQLFTVEERKEGCKQLFGSQRQKSSTQREDEQE